MSDRDSADRFSVEVDRLLGDEAGLTHVEAMPDECRRNLGVARMLAAADLSGESRFRQALKSRLREIGARDLNSLRRQERKETLMRALRDYVWKPLPAVSMAVMILALAVLPLVWPGALPAAAQSVDGFVRGLVVGEHTTVSHIAGGNRSEPTTPGLQDRMWLVQTAVGAFGGNVAEGADPTVRYYASAESAQKANPDLRICQPGYLPLGYWLHGVLLTPPDGVILTYGNLAAGDIVLVETPVSGQKSVGAFTNAPVEAMTLNGQQAAWIETTAGQNSLTWEADGVSYTVGGIGLSRDEAIRIAQSLK